MSLMKLGRTSRRSVTIAVTGAGVAATVLFGGGVAQAFSSLQERWTGTNECQANLYVEPGTYVGQSNSHDYAQAGVYESSQFKDNESGDCEGWLERSTDGGHNWNMLGDLHFTTGRGTSDATGWYYDGPGYMARACARDTWKANPDTCTAGF
jgi:hypothetical protein